MHARPTPSAERRLIPEIQALYAASDAETTRIRARHLLAVVRRTPQLMAANLGSSAIVLWVFRHQWSVGMWVWAGLLWLISVVALRSWWRQRDRRIETASAAAIRRSTWHAAWLASMWAVMPLAWFGSATGPQQVIIGTLTTGMLGAGAFALSTLPLASLAWVAIVAFGALAALAGSGEPTYAGLAVLLSLYAPVVALGSVDGAFKSILLLRSRAEAERQERMLALLLQDFEQHAGEALWETGLDGRLTHLSPRLANLLGVDEATALSVPLLILLSLRGADVAPLRAAIDEERPFRDVVLTLPSPAGPRHLSLHGKRLLDEHGHTIGWRGVLADITEAMVAQQNLHRMAHTDGLTGLANRATLRGALAKALDEGRRGALLALDLDHFKAVNDTLGHTAGDELLMAVSRRLANGLRDGDLVARLGGDEFAVLVNHTDDPVELGHLAQRLIDALEQPVELGGRVMRVGASVGVATFGHEPIGVDELVIQADIALYEAKAAGRGRHCVYQPRMGEHSRRGAMIEQGLRRALAKGELSLAWQPKVEIENWQIVGAEALMRWRHDELGQVGPDEFISVAERTGMIDELGTWVLREACRAAAGPLSGLIVSVNVSPAQLRDGRFAAQVSAALHEFGTDPSMLELEITESVFMGDVPSALDELHALRSLGVRVALDDFGTGYSSLAYLRRFPFDTLKIDRAFVNEVLLRPDAKAIVTMITQLADTLGMRTIAEGVETAQQLAAVSQAGCQEVQGYLVSKPRPLDEFLTLRRNWSRPPLLAALH